MDQLEFCGRQVSKKICVPIYRTLWSDFNTTVKDSKVREEFINQVRDRLVKELNNQQQIVLLKDSSCYTSFKNFVCNWNFPSCDNNNKTIPVCNSICTNYYTNCLLDITPCLQLFRSLVIIINYKKKKISLQEFRVIVDFIYNKTSNKNFIKIIIKQSKMCNDPFQLGLYKSEKQILVKKDLKFMLKRLPQYLFSKVPFYGGADQLVNLISLQQTQNHQQIELSWRQLCDLELLINGALTPLDSYMDRQTYESVCINSRLPNGTLFPIPFILEIPKNKKVGEFVNLTRKGQVIAEVQITDLWDPNRRIEIEAYGGDPDHPEVQRINNLDVLYAGGKIKAFQPNYWTDFLSFRQTPTQIRELIQKWDRVVAFQTRNPMHFAHIELVKRAAQEINANILLQPVSGPTKDGDIDYVTRMKAYEAVYPSFDANKTLLNLLPLAMRMGGPREALLHCIIRQNYGATHFILGRDHAGPGSNSKGVDFYKPYEARDHVLKNQKEFSIIPVPFDMVVYVENDKKYYLESEIPKGAKALKLSGTEVRRRLRDGEDIPEWFSPPKVVNILRKKYESDKWSEINKQLLDKNAKQIIQYAYDKFGGDIAISFSGAEDVILIEYAQQLGLPIQVFSLDTGRLHSETYKYFDQVEKHYNIQIQYCFPESQAVQQLVRNKGLFSFYKDGHNECCNVRKVQPLAKQLNTLKAWITGMRKDQNVTRVEVPLVTVDSMFVGKNDQSLIKFNPLSAVTSAEVWQDILYYNVPYNSLHQRGFVSIGCEPCTKAILPNQHEREGRWWWEEATQKECGLHQKK